MSKLATTTLRRYIPVGLAILVGSLLSVVAFSVVEMLERDRAEFQFDQAAAARISAVIHRIHVDVDVVRSIVDFFGSSYRVERDEFRSFVSATLSRSGSIQALEWIPRVPASERAAYEKAAREDGYPDFQITDRKTQGEMVPAGQRAEYFPVYYVEPYEGNEPALGFDLASNATRLAALTTSRDSGELQASGRITLVQEPGGQSGFLVFSPIYRTGLPHETVEQRRKNLAGFALGVFRIGDMIAGAFSASYGGKLKGPGGLDLYLYDTSAKEGERLLHIHHSRARNDLAPVLDEQEARSGPHLAETFEVGGRTWAIVARPISPDFGRGTAWESWAALLVTLMFTAMLAAYLLQSLNRARQTERLVSKRTIELTAANESLNESEARAQAIVNTATDAIIAIDERGIIERFNPASERLFGYTADAAIGRNVKILMPSPYHDEHDGYLAHYFSTGEKKIIGIGREVIGKRKDGTTFPIELAVSEVRSGDRHMFTGIIRDITERKNIERMKDEFISIVSHELRTPLTSIVGSLGLIRGGVLGELPEKIEEMIDIAHKNSDRLVRLINDILDIEKIEAGKIELRNEPLEVIPLIEQAIEENRAYGEEFGVAFAIEHAVPGVKVYADSDRLIRVITNLLSNAAKFSPRGDTVELSVSRHDGAIRVAVSDHGPGISEEFRDRIFEKFAQADTSDAREKGGTGLGLSICKAIVERLGGRIGFDSTLGAGTTFYFDLPEWREAETADIAEAAADDRPRILICEDDQDTATLLRMMLEQGGYGSDVAYTAEHAKRLLAERSYALMTLDILLPDQDGISLIRELRAEESTRDLPVVVVSVKAKNEATEPNSNGIAIVDWLKKPIDPERLLAAVDSAVKHKRDDTPRILHVEDDADVVRVVATLIKDLAEVIPAATLREAKKMLKKEHFDLVILDLAMPDGSGMGLLPLLQNRTPPVPVLIFSAHDVNRKTAEMVAAVMVKSHTSNERLLETIASLIGAPSRAVPSGDGSSGDEEASTKP